MNKKLEILKFLGIISVVFYHCGREFISYLPQWRMAMFIFASGYFFQEANIYNIGIYIRKKFKKLMLPCYGWQLFYGIVISTFLWLGFVKFGSYLSIKNLIFDTILHGHQYVFPLALWFVPILFFTQVIYLIIKRICCNYNISDYVLLILLVFLNIVSVELSFTDFNRIIYPNLFLPLSKVMFFMVFFHIGYLYRNKIEKFDNEFSCIKLIIPFLINFAIVKCLHLNISYIPSGMIFYNYSFLPLLTTLTGIYFYLHLSGGIILFLKNDKIYQLLKNVTFPIMIHHLFCFWVLNTLFWHLYLNDIIIHNFDYNAYMSNIFYWPQFKFYYIMFAIVGIIGSLVIDYIYKQLKNKIILKIK